MVKARNAAVEGLFDLGGASALAAAVGFALVELAPAASPSPTGIALAAAAATFAAAYAVLRPIGAVAHAVRVSELVPLAIPPIPKDDEAMVPSEAIALADTDRRVVHLFPERADGHRGAVSGAGVRRAPPPTSDGDAREALNLALAEVRRSLR